jgi:hypothetical protein
MVESKELQVKEKQEVAVPAEQTRPGLVFTPEVDSEVIDQNKIDAKLEDGVLRLSRQRPKKPCQVESR